MRTTVGFSLCCFAFKYLHFYLCTGCSPALQPWPENSPKAEVKVHTVRQINSVISTEIPCAGNPESFFKCFIDVLQAEPQGVVVTQLVLLKQNKHLEAMDGCLYLAYTVAGVVMYLQLCSVTHLSVSCFCDSLFDCHLWYNTGQH